MSGKRDKAVTSRIMSAVGNKDSRPELALRSELHRRRMRYRLHTRDVMGRPDVVIRKYRLAVFLDGMRCPARPIPHPDGRWWWSG